MTPDMVNKLKVVNYLLVSVRIRFGIRKWISLASINPPVKIL
jgi:hypothetical protein